MPRKAKPRPASVIIGPVRMEAELAARLKAHAAADSRSIANVINLAVREYLKKHVR